MIDESVETKELEDSPEGHVELENATLHEALRQEDFLRARMDAIALNPKQRIPFTLSEHHVLSSDRSSCLPSRSKGRMI
jgi:hypothetical protein